CPLFFLAVESHSFTVADWLLEYRKKLLRQEDDRIEVVTIQAIDAYNKWGDTALTRCCGRAAVIQKGCDRLHQTDITGNTAMHRLAASIPSTADGQTVVRPVLNALLNGLSVDLLTEWLAKRNHAGERAAALVSNAAMLDALLEALEISMARATKLGHSQAPNSTASCCFARPAAPASGHSLAAFGSLEAVEPTKLKAANFRLQWSMAALATTASSAFSDDASRDPVLGCVQAALRDGSAAPLRGLIRGSGSDDSSGLGLAL
uniref:ANK_REP_REGION domain-containing protein n=1 Tax=Macrostomum lignano TaxID=282301 RepID=A0A1I8JMQ1_9PLAT